MFPKQRSPQQTETFQYAIKRANWQLLGDYPNRGVILNFRRRMCWECSFGQSQIRQIRRVPLLACPAVREMPPRANRLWGSHRGAAQKQGPQERLFFFFGGAVKSANIDPFPKFFFQEFEAGFQAFHPADQLGD